MSNEETTSNRPGRNGADPCDEIAAPTNSFETALARIEAIVHDLEDGKVGLAEALERYEEGVKLMRQCHNLLQKAERRIEILTGVDAAGNPVTQPFDDTASTEQESASATAARSRKRSAKPTPQPESPAPESPPPTAEEFDTPRSLF